MWLTISNSIHQAKPPTYFNNIEDIFIMHWPLFIKGFNQTLNWLELIFYATSYTWMKVYFLLFLSGSRFETLHGWNRFYFMFNRLHKGESLRKQSGLTLRFINGKLLATGVKKKNSNGGAILFSLLVLVSSKKKKKAKDGHVFCTQVKMWWKLHTVLLRKNVRKPLFASYFRPTLKVGFF